MKFKDLYPQPKRTIIGPVHDINPVKEMPDLGYGGGCYFCQNCKALTNWHFFKDNMVWMVCSQECLENLLKPVDTAKDQEV